MKNVERDRSKEHEAWNAEQLRIEREKCKEAEACQDASEDHEMPKRVIQKYFRDGRRAFEHGQKVKMKVRR